MSQHLEDELANHVVNTSAELESIRRQIATLRETVPRPNAVTSFNRTTTPEFATADQLKTLSTRLDMLIKQFDRLLGTVERGFLDVAGH